MLHDLGCEGGEVVAPQPRPAVQRRSPLATRRVTALAPCAAPSSPPPSTRACSPGPDGGLLPYSYGTPNASPAATPSNTPATRSMSIRASEHRHYGES